MPQVGNKHGTGNNHSAYTAVMIAVFGKEARDISRVGGYKFGFAMVTWAVIGNLLGAIAVVFSSPHLPFWLRSLGLECMQLREISFDIQSKTAVGWVILGLFWSCGDSLSGRLSRNHCLEMGGSLGGSYILLAVAIIIYEMFFR